VWSGWPDFRAVRFNVGSQVWEIAKVGSVRSGYGKGRMGNT